MSLKWTPIENAKVIGMLPEYRVLFKKYNSSLAATEIAKSLTDKDEIGVFDKRKANVDDLNATIGAHITRMNDIASGKIKPEYGDEPNWAGCFPEI